MQIIPCLKNTEIRNEIWNKDCISQISSLKNKLHGMRYSAFKRLFGEELYTFAGSNVTNVAGKPLKLLFLHMNKYLRMATIHQMKRQELWEGFSSTPQLSQREIPSAFLFLLIECF